MTTSKPLHEAIREKTSSCPNSNDVVIVDVGDTGMLMTKRIADELANEIENEYIPWPLLTTGEPVRFGMFVNDKKRGRIQVRRISFVESGFYFNESKPHGCNTRPKGIVYDYGERVEEIAPETPQALDADGKQTFEGDRVWDLTDGLEWRVDKVDLGMLTCKRDRSEGWQPGEPTMFRTASARFTHEEFRFDANGVRTRVGDEVFYEDDPNPLTVTKIYGRKLFFSDGMYCSPEYVSHINPDTYERLCKDIVDYLCDCKLNVDAEVAEKFSARCERLLNKMVGAK